MFQKIKNLPLNIPAILICLSAVFIFSFFTKADSGAKIQFTADTIVSLTGITDGDLYIASNSECDSLSVSGSTLTIGDIPADSDFILKTSAHNNALKITPSGGVLDLTFDSVYLSSGRITQWTLEGSGSTQVAYQIGTPENNKWYAIKVNGVLLNNYQSNISNEISFTYSGGWSSKVFTIENGSAPGGGLPPAAYNPPIQPESTPENPDGNFSVLINNGDEYTDNQTVILKLYAGSDTMRMAISNAEDFENASQVLYQEEIEWDLQNCNTPRPLRDHPSQEGNICTVYAKFYTQYGVASEVVSDSIIYQTEKESFIKIPEIKMPETIKEITEEISKTIKEIPETIKKIPEIIESLIPEFLKPKPPEIKSPEVYPEDIESKEMFPETEEAVSPEISSEEKETGLLNSLLGFGKWLWQEAVNFWQKIWPF